MLANTYKNSTLITVFLGYHTVYYLSYLNFFRSTVRSIMQEWKSVLFLWVYSLKGGEQLSIIQQKYGKSIRLDLFSFDMTYQGFFQDFSWGGAK